MQTSKGWVRIYSMETHGRSFTTTTTIKLCYKSIEFTPHSNLVHNFKVDNTPKQNTEEYDIIIGRDIICNLGVDFKFSTAITTMSWDNISIPMWKKGFRSKKYQIVIPSIFIGKQWLRTLQTSPMSYFQMTKKTLWKTFAQISWYPSMKSSVHRP